MLTGFIDVQNVYEPECRDVFNYDFTQRGLQSIRSFRRSIARCAVKRFAIVAQLAACNGDPDPEWQLDHDRIIRTRATPLPIALAAARRLDGLNAHAGGQGDPARALAIAKPSSPASTLTREGADWIVTAPAEAQLVEARPELALPKDAPVPIVIGVLSAVARSSGRRSSRRSRRRNRRSDA